MSALDPERNARGVSQARWRHRRRAVILSLAARVRSLCKKIAGWPKAVWIWFLLWFARRLQRATNAAWFQRSALRPVGHAIAWAVLVRSLWKLFRDPDTLAQNAPPDLSQQIASYKTLLDGQVNREIADSSRAVDQAMTWGVGGIAIALLTAILAIHTTAIGALIGAGCFALAIPLLAVCGVVHANYNNPSGEAPTMRETLHLHALIIAGQLTVCVGLAAVLWSYDLRVSVVFLAGCYLSWCYLTAAGNRRIAKKSATPP